jgi:cellulose synthase operon protein C
MRDAANGVHGKESKDCGQNPVEFDLGCLEDRFRSVQGERTERRMESRMSVACGALRKSSLVAGCLFLALLPGLAQICHAQTASRKATAEAAATLNLMVEKGHALEARGRPDMAIQVWQQILLSDPNNVESLAGMARDLKLTGSDKAIEALDRLRKASPNNPDIAKIEGLAGTRAESAQLSQAGDLARQGKTEDAMRLYRQLYGDHPPDGDIALAYYQTLYGTANGKPEAIAGMRALSQRNPGDPGYAVQLGVMLTSTQATRGEGIRILKEHSKDATAQVALRQALVWDAANPSSVIELRDYLKDHPQDTELAARLKENEGKLAQTNAGATVKPLTRLEYASIQMQAKRYDQAVTLYKQMLSDEPGNLSAWMGLLSAHHEMSQDTQAIADVEKMTPTVHESAFADPAFLILLGSIYRQAGQYEVAQDLLQRAAKLQIAAGGQPSVQLQVNLAGIYLQRNDIAQAFASYQQVLKNNPECADAWKGLIAALEAGNRNADALQQLPLIPTAARKQLDTDIEFVQTEFGIYVAAGDTDRATALMNRVQAHYAKLHSVPPASVEIQIAWLLYNTGNDRALYAALMQLGGRGDLSVAQREAIQDIWANWAVHRAAAAMDNGSAQRAVDILDAASLAFPGNMTVRKAVAAGYVRVGRAKESLAIYKTVPMENATASDFQGAVNAAFEANDMNQAGAWLRQALERFPHDPAVLSLAGRYEQARGDNQGAADYDRASLAAMPSASPVERLTHVLVYSDQNTGAHHAITAADLERLLDPDNEPFAKVTTIQPLHAPDRYDAAAPVAPTPAPQTQQKPDAPKIFPPSASQGQTSTAPVYVPQS